jgi:hypothetical protein
MRRMSAKPRVIDANNGKELTTQKFHRDARILRGGSSEREEKACVFPSGRVVRSETRVARRENSKAQQAQT